MGNYTREEILQMVEEEDVEFIRLQFTDMFGAIKNIAVTARELPRGVEIIEVCDRWRTDCRNIGIKRCRSVFKTSIGYICDSAMATTTGKSSPNDL